MPNFSNFSGCSTGYWTSSLSSRFTSSRPPTSAHDTSGTSTTDSRSELGLQVLSAFAKWALVTSRAAGSNSRSAASLAHVASWSSPSRRPAASTSSPAFLSASRTQSRAASVQSWATSAPTKPWQSRATSSRSTSPARLMPRVFTARISRRAASSGTSRATSRSRRPKRRRAGSRSLGLPVAASTTTPDAGFRPSMSVRSCAQMRLSCSLSALSRFCAMHSISSIMITDGAAFSAAANFARSTSSASPGFFAATSPPLSTSTLQPHS
mmetsp:Transcript_5738/g.19569  ORF Transcript_5738/g.19569 Transcript_5738/m.19569 type:complete len:267 (-) Transcript_5738:1219-2019(-)